MQSKNEYLRKSCCWCSCTQPHTQHILHSAEENGLRVKIHNYCYCQSDSNNTTLLNVPKQQCEISGNYKGSRIIFGSNTKLGSPNCTKKNLFD